MNSSLKICKFLESSLVQLEWRQQLASFCWKFYLRIVFQYMVLGIRSISQFWNGVSFFHTNFDPILSSHVKIIYEMCDSSSAILEIQLYGEKIVQIFGLDLWNENNEVSNYVIFALHRCCFAVYHGCCDCYWSLLFLG